nr:glycosyltransferase [Actinomycetota bacterium]
LLPAIDVFTLSSLQEGLPLSLLEAMAAGIPCVATAVGGVPEVLTDGREGFLVPPGDAQGLAAAIQRLVDDEELRRRMGTAAAGTARGFSVGSAVERVQRLYTSVLGADEAAREPHGP